MWGHYQLRFSSPCIRFLDAFHIYIKIKVTFLHAKLEGCLVDFVLVVECYVAHFVLTVTQVLGLRYLILEGVSREVITILSDPHGVAPWAVYGLIQDCLSLIQTFDYVGCNHVKCVANSLADQLAKHGLGSKTIMGWSMLPPSWSDQDLSFDIVALE